MSPATVSILSSHSPTNLTQAWGTQATNIPRLQLLGHEGMLTAQQEAALAEFRSALDEAGLYTPFEPSTGRRPSHSDTDLL